MHVDETKLTKRQKTYNQLQDIREKKARWWKKLSRAVNAYDQLSKAEERILKRQEPPKQGAELKVTSDDWHKIRHQDFGDTLSDIAS